MKKLVALLAFGVISSASAVTERQNIQMVANITGPSAMVITPTAGTWPTVAQTISWDGTSFVNPTPIGFTAKSTADISVSLASNAVLVDGLATIPVDVAINSVAGSGVNIPKLSLLPKPIYVAADNNAGADLAGYTIAITGNKTGMTDHAGVTGIVEPAPGNYAGVVSLVFESNI